MMKFSYSLFFMGLQMFFFSMPLLAMGYQSHIPGSGENEDLAIEGTGEKGPGAYIPGSFPDEVSKKIEKGPPSPYFPHSGKEKKPSVTWREKKLGFENQAPFQYENRKHLIQHEKSDLFNHVYNKGEKSFYLFYIRSGYEVSDGEGLFKRIFENNAVSEKTKRPHSRQTGSFHLGFDRSLYRGWVRFAYGVSFGLGHYSGKGFFANGEISERTRFILLTMPLDFMFLLELPVGKYMSLQTGGGPSLVGLWQSRSDKDHGEDEKHRRQLGYGLTGTGRLKISLANIFRKGLFGMFKAYSVTNFYLNLEARYQRYRDFRQRDILIFGTSFGLGLSFDYL